MEIVTRSVEETLALGRLIGKLAPVQGVTCIALDGPLGAGKTHLTHGIAEGAGVDDPTLVSSPTYVLLNVYPGPKPVYHLDAYRVAGPADFEAVGLEEVLSGSGGGRIVVVEWASKLVESMPMDRIEIAIEHEGDGQVRLLRMSGQGERSAQLLQAVEKARAGF